MKALVIHAAKDLRIEDVAYGKPAAGEVQIEIATGGICGSDLHYYNHGGFGSVRLRESMILGHEVSGYVRQFGKDVRNLTVGDLVAVSPSRPCSNCRFCRKGEYNHCLNMRFYGSAMPSPHIQGAFRQVLVASAAQCVRANGLTAGEAAMGEPFAVALHAMKQAGDLLGKRILVTGCGPIGVLCVIAAKRAGAVEIVATDLAKFTMDQALLSGADVVLNPTQDDEKLQEYTQHKGYFDVHFECSGAETALLQGISAIKPRGVIVQLGLGGDMALPMMQITAKEIQLKGSFRFHEEFSVGIELMQSGMVDVKPLITHTVPLDDAEEAFRIANDRSQAMKTQIEFSA